jgi:hypothetical protein
VLRQGIITTDDIIVLILVQWNILSVMKLLLDFAVTVQKRILFLHANDENLTHEIKYHTDH